MVVGMNAHWIRTKAPHVFRVNAYIRSMRFQFPSPPNGGCLSRIFTDDPSGRIGRIKPGTEDAGPSMYILSDTATP